MLPRNEHDESPETNQIFHGIETRIYQLLEKGRAPAYPTKEAVIEGLVEHVFALSPTSAIYRIDKITREIELHLQELDDSCKDEEFQPVYLDDLHYLLQELIRIKSRLQKIKERTNKPSDTSTNLDGTAIKKIRTNLSVDEIAVLFKILNEFDDAEKSKKMLKEYPNKSELFRHIASAFSSIKENNLSEKSLDSKYGSNDQSASAEFWIAKFIELSEAAKRMAHSLNTKKDKPRNKKMK